jgi:phosphohistidine phosphatase
MKKLFIIRHAKSSWDSKVRSDFDRPLNKRGLRDAPMMGKILKKAKIIPDLILASSAKRAKKTAIFISNEIGYKENDIVFDEDLYLSSVDELVDIISEVDSDINTLFIVAHNPGVTNFVNSFCKEKISNLPTTGIFSMEFDISSWKSISTQSAKKCFFDYPKRHQL